MFTGHRSGALSATIGVVTATAVLIGVAGVQTTTAQVDAAPTVARIGDSVARYYQRAQSLIADETVTIQPLTRDLAWDGFARRLLYEMRLEWNPDATGDESPATVTRQLISVNGRPPRPRDEPECFDPKPVSPEPLAFLLPEQRDKFTWAHAGLGRLEGRPAVMVDWKSIMAGEPKTTFDEHKRSGIECTSVELPGHWKGRVWVDPETSEVLRLVESLTGMVDVPASPKQQKRGAAMYLTLERAEVTTDFKPVAFRDPDETVLLPSRIETLTIWRHAGGSRTRITQTLGNYRRFITGSRIVQ